MTPTALVHARRIAVRFAVLAVTAAGVPVATGGLSPQAAPAAPPMSFIGTNATAATVKTSLETVEVPKTSPAERRELRRSADGLRVVSELSNTSTRDFGLLGVTWELGTASADLRVQIRTRTGEVWTRWQNLEVEERQRAEAEAARGGTSPTWVGESDGVGVRLVSAGEAPAEVEVVLIDGGTGLAEPAGFESSDGTLARVSAEVTDPATESIDPVPGDLAGTEGTTVPTATGVAPQPAIVTRSEWGVDRNYESSCSSPLTASRPRGILLHHTAGANAYSRAEAPGIMRGMHLYHTRSLGWCDIGYNFVVDKYGTVYEGRRGGITKQVRGAHAGNWDANLYLTGISMMGNYDTAELTSELKRSVVALAAWRLSYFGIADVIDEIGLAGQRVDMISGHRDIYSSGIRPATATACPGRYGYEWLNNGMRGAVQRRIDAAAGGVVDDGPFQELPDDGAPVQSPTPTPTPTPIDPGPLMSRLAGADRYATAASISQRSFTMRNGAVFLASGASYADALSGGPAAAGQSAPVLLARPTKIPAVTVAELERLAPSRIYILGGEAALSAEVFNQAAQYAERVTRLAGIDRYETGVEITRRLWSRSDTVYVASGADYPDALSGGALAARHRAPILLATTRGLSSTVRSELARLNPSRVVLLGGTGALSAAVKDQVAQTVPSATVSRLAGANRYATSAAIAKAGWSKAERAYFALGTDFPDALAGVPAAGIYGSPLLLTKDSCVPTPVSDAATLLGPDLRIILGGSDVLSDSASTEPC